MGNGYLNDVDGNDEEGILIMVFYNLFLGIVNDLIVLFFPTEFYGGYSRKGHLNISNIN